MSAAIRAGYKQTEVGVIPLDWDVARLSTVARTPVQNGVFNEPARKGRGCKLINVGDLYSAAPINTENLEKFDATKGEISKFGVAHGDLFFTRSSITPDGIAHCNIYEQTKHEAIVFDCHIIRVQTNTKIVDPLFLSKFCITRPARIYLVANAKTTTMTTVDQAVIGSLPVPVPPLPEQRAIATALSDVDALLAKLDQFVAKKRDLKQAAMQQLLTGQTRLPGFSGEWEVKRLGDVLSRMANGAVYKPTNSSGIQITRIETIADGTIDYSRTGVAEDRPELERYKIIPGDILFSHINSLDHIGKVAIFSGEQPLYHGMNLLLLRTNREAHSHFLYFWFTSLPARRQTRNLAKQAVSQASINTKELKALEIRLPPMQEQTAIATILSDMDAELAALEARRAKTRALKQGMMQELLTGRIRLV